MLKFEQIKEFFENYSREEKDLQELKEALASSKDGIVKNVLELSVVSKVESLQKMKAQFEFDLHSPAEETVKEAAPEVEEIAGEEVAPVEKADLGVEIEEDKETLRELPKRAEIRRKESKFRIAEDK